jgi:ADP-ribosylglycohydrolase
MVKMSPPKITGREMRDSYVNSKGPGNIPKEIKWKQHMDLDTSESTKDFVHRMLDWDDEDVAGFGDRPESRLSTACYCEHTFTLALYLAYKYAQDPKKALLQNVMLGGHSTSRGAVLGAILGAAHGTEAIPFKEDLCAKNAIDKEVTDLLGTLRE